MSRQLNVCSGTLAIKKNEELNHATTERDRKNMLREGNYNQYPVINLNGKG